MTAGEKRAWASSSGEKEIEVGRNESVVEMLMLLVHWVFEQGKPPHQQPSAVLYVPEIFPALLDAVGGAKQNCASRGRQLRCQIAMDS